jgi:hypothetical protein
MKHSKVLIVDAAINLILGVLLITCPMAVVEFLGVPLVKNTFYPAILGGVLFGIGVALLIECFRDPNGLIGLGLGGAIAINLCGGAVLAAWLMFADLMIPLRGRVFLWSIVILLVAISAVELCIHVNEKRLADIGDPGGKVG